MHASPSIFDRAWAALIFFTRLPFWRIHEPPQEAYDSVVEFWPLAGWLTGGVMAATLYAASWLMPYEIAVIAAIVARLLLTGALHEDGLADFFDAFGAGGSRQRILDIMKDSRIGTYGVLALVIYLLTLFFALYSLEPETAALTILAADPFAKMSSAQITQMMPYARTEETAKNRTVYRRFTFPAALGLALQGLLPIAIYAWIMRDAVDATLLVVLPALVSYALCLYVRQRLQGYTGDCCGALFLLTELTAYLVVV